MNLKKIIKKIELCNEFKNICKKISLGNYILFSFLFLLILILFFLKFNPIIYPEDKNYKSNKIVLKSTGSTSMSKLLSVLGEKFAEENEGFSYEKSESGSEIAISEVIKGNYDLGDISRYLKEEEKDKKINQIIVAYDAMSLIVNKSNPISNLSSEDILNIFSGKIKNWIYFANNFDNKITTISREEFSGSRVAFENLFNFTKENMLKANIEFPESGDIDAYVSNDKDAIGYVSDTSVSNNVKKLKIDGKECSIENIKNGEYKLFRPFIQVYVDGSSLLISKWLDFVKSYEVKKIIESEGFISDLT